MNAKTVWITGASSGIGEALAYAYDQRGWNLILSARNIAKMEEIRSRLKSPAKILRVDVGDCKTIKDIVSEALQLFGNIDLLINNAGISQRCFIEESTIDIDRQIFEINYFGNIELSRQILPHMLRRKQGQIAVISSLAGKMSTPGRSAYSASKHALLGWYDALRAEVADRNVRVNVICPGYIKTDISINALRSDGAKNNKMDSTQANGMSAEECALQIYRAIEKNKAEVLIGGKEKYGVLIRKFLPGLYRIMLRKMAVSRKDELKN